MNHLLRSPSGPVGQDIAKRADAVAQAARGRAPTLTGALRSSIWSGTRAGAEGVIGQAGASVRYARYVEFGTSKMSAQAFFGPALNAAV